jgi:ankyrin repeat protein
MGYIPVNAAALQGHMAVVKALVEHGADVNIVFNYGSTPLLNAAQEGHIHVVKVLIEHGVDVNIASNDSKTPVSVAAQNGHMAVVRVLAEHDGAEISGTSTGQSAVIGAAINGHMDTISFLYALGADMAPTPLLGVAGTEAADVARSSGHEEAALLIESMLCKLAVNKCHHCGHSPMAKHALNRCGVCNTTLLYCSRDSQEKDLYYYYYYY